MIFYLRGLELIFFNEYGRYFGSLEVCLAGTAYVDWGLLQSAYFFSRPPGRTVNLFYVKKVFDQKGQKREVSLFTSLYARDVAHSSSAASQASATAASMAVLVKLA